MDHPEAAAMLQWAVGLEICRAFSALEQYLLDFVDEEHVAVGPTRSALLLYQEERKHIALFDRYGDHLAAQHPEWMADFEEAFAPCMPALLHPYTQDAYPDPAIQHYFFWLKTLFFEEYTIFLHDRLLKEKSVVQPTWLKVHWAHRVEEHQHVITDAAYVEALDMSPTKRRACATAFWSHLEQTFDLFLGVAASRRLIRSRFPALAHLLPEVPTRQLPLFQSVLTHPLFRLTRRCAPGAERMKTGPHLVDALNRAAESEHGITWISERAADCVESYAALRHRASGVLDALRKAGIKLGDAVVIPAARPEEAVAVFWATQLGGMVAVLVDAQTPGRLESVSSVLPDAHVLEDLSALLSHQPAGPVLPTPSAEDAVAVVQFSSGSTGAARGIQLTHQNLHANIDAIIGGLSGRPTDSFVSWLPLFHDMGLIGYHLLPIVLCARQALMSTRHFLKRPMDWLEALDRLGGTVSASPNFGLSLTVDRLDADRVAQLDLSAVHCMLNGAEPIRAETMSRFAEALAPAGFRPEALTPAYGLAEATLCLTARPTGERWTVHQLDRAALHPGATATADPHGIALVGVGVPVSGVQLRIVDASGRTLPDGVVGEIEATGPNVTQGYVGDAQRPEDAFRGQWLRTGDLGFIRDGRLVVTGRHKEMLIVHGQNLYAHDIESALAGIDGLKPRQVAALCDPIAEKLYIAAVTRGQASVRAAIVERIQQRFSITPAEIFDVRRIPRTSSGKLQRYRLREALLYPSAPNPQPQSTPQTAELPSSLMERVRAAWAEALSKPAADIPDNADFRTIGGTSIQAAHVHAILEDELGPLPLSVLMTSSTLSGLAEQLSAYAPQLEAAAATPTVVDAEPQQQSNLRPDDIAIIGMGLRLPGADTPEALWSMLLQGSDAFREVPPSRWDHDRYDGIGAGVGAFLEDLFGFDARGFGLSDADAAAADPRQRLFLEAAAAAMQDAGLGSGRVGVFASQGESPENCRSFLDDLEQGRSSMTGRLENSTNNMVAARVSRTFNLTGPAIVVQAACASSLVAVHQARRSLQHSECDAAIVGGVELLHSPTLYTLFHPAGVLSEGGRCRPFTEDADGFVPGEGAAALVLRRLDDAQRDGDRILAVIRGSAVGNDGRGFSSMAPNPAGQVTVARQALAEAGVPADSIGMLEAHGTATAFGDAVELKAMSDVYRDIPVTAVKSNLGHLLAAAGAASVIKTVLSLQHGTIPPIANFTTANRRLEGALRPASAAVPWPPGIRRAAINGLGIGGTNCHLILEQPPEGPAQPAQSQTLLCLSARTEAGLKRRAAQLADWATGDMDRDALCGAINRAASLHPLRVSAVVQTTEEARAFLSDIPSPAPQQRVAVLFPGPGSLSAGLPSFLTEHPASQAALDACDVVIQAKMGTSLSDLLRHPLDRIDTAQPAAFAASWATWRWLQAMGVTPTAFVGHSAGEYAALAAAGVLSMPDALEALIERGRAMAAAPAGEMAAVFARPEVVSTLLDGAEIAAYNDPNQVVISGSSLTRTLENLTARGIHHHRLSIPCAAHSASMVQAQPALSRALEGLRFERPHTTLYSSMQAVQLSAVTGAYLCEQLRAPVRFDETVSAMVADGITTLVEVGATPVLSQNIASAQALSVFRQDEPSQPLRVLSTLFSGGQNIKLGQLTPGTTPLPTPLPAFPYQRDQHPIALAQEQHDRVSRGAPAAVAQPQAEWQLTDSDRELFEAHRAEGTPIAPAAWMLEQLFKSHGQEGTLSSVSITAPMGLDGCGTWRIVASEGRVTLESGIDGNTQAHLTGAWSAPTPIDAPPPPRGAALDSEVLYEALAAGGLTYGQTMRSMSEVYVDGDEIWATLYPSAPFRVEWIDPSILDGAFQAIVAWLQDEVPGRPFLGFAIGEVRLLRPLLGPCQVYLKQRSRSADVLRCDLTLTDALGRPCLALRDFCARRKRVDDARLFGLGWAPHDLPARGTPAAGLPLLEPTPDELTALTTTAPRPDEVFVVTESAPVAAMARSLARPDMRVRVLHGAPTPTALRAAMRASAPVLRWAAGQLLAPTLQQINTPAAPIAAGGAIWIIGGTGGIGRSLATHLAPGRTIILSGRREMLDHSLKQELMEAGARVEYHQLDLSDAAGVSALAEKLHRTHGPLRGVIHSAGVLRGSREAVMAAKAAGGNALLEALVGVPVGFLALVSSLSAVVPSPGQEDYAAANAALDALLDRVPDSVEHAFTINYGPWSEVGMVADQAASLQRSGLPPMTPQAGVRSFLQALASGQRQVLALALPDGAIARLRESVGVPGSAPSPAPQSEADRAVVNLPACVEPTRPTALEAIPAPKREDRTPLPMPEEPPQVRPGVSEVIRTFLSKRLGCPVERLEPSMSFAELGVDSLTGVELVRALERAFNMQLYPTLLFEHPILGDFERQLMQQLPSAPRRAATQLAPEPSGSVRCYTVDRSGGEVRFALTERPAAALAADEIRVSVGAWGVNFIDVLARVGLHPALKDECFVPGHEIAGTVTEVGEAVRDFKPGDRVMGMPGSGGYAEEVVLPERLAMHIPDAMSIEEGASLMVTGLTAIACIEQAAQLRQGESVLIQSASGATGSACVQLALHHGATVYGTASTEEKRAALREMGVHHVIDYVLEDFDAVIRRTAGSVDVIVDALAGDAIPRGISVLSEGGRFIEIGAGAAIQVPQLDPQAMFLNNQAFLGVNLSQMMKRPTTLAALKARLYEAVAQGAITPVVGHKVPFSQADQAHALLRERRSIGKIILVR